MWLLLIIGGIFLINLIIKGIKSLLNTHREKIRNRVASDVFFQSSFDVEGSIKKYKEKVEKNIKKDEILWENDPDWIHNKHFQRQIFGSLYKSHRYEELEDRCPDCSKGFLRIRKGKYGKFLGCSNFPSCKYTKNIEKAKEEYKVSITSEFLKDLEKAYS